jgi:hypothetical protein
MFHKVQDSFITSYRDIVSRELTLESRNDNAPTSLQYGPYYIAASPESYLTIEGLMEKTRKLDEQEGVRTGLRQWLTLLKEGSGRGAQHLKRLKKFNHDKKGAPELIDALTSIRHDKDDRAVAAGDCLTLYTILYQETKSEEEKA